MSKLFQIGKALVTGDFDNVVKSIDSDIIISPATYQTPNGNGWSFSTAGGVHSYFEYKDFNSCVEAYTKCPPVNAIINRKAQAFINGKTWVLNTLGKEATSSPAKKLKALLDQPNPLQSWDQFEAQMYIYVQVFGYCPMLAIKPAGYTENIDATSLWNIPPPIIDVKKTNKIFKQYKLDGIIQSIVIRYNGEETTVPLNDICIIKDFTPSLSSDDYYILPASRIKALSLPINNIIGAYESRNILINYRGALGIFSKDNGGAGALPPPPISPAEKEDLQKDFRRYGLRNNQWQFIITSAALKWQSISVPTKDLMLFEETEDGAMRICDSYNYPYQLLSAAKGTTFSNMDAGMKLVYQDATLPEAKSIYGQLNTFFKTVTYNIRLDKDYSHVAALQQNEVEKMDARLKRNQAYAIEWDNNLCTLNEWRIANGDDPVEGGDLRKSEIVTDTSQPLALSLGVGGLQGLIEVATAGISEDAKQAILVDVFGLLPATAARISAGGAQQQSNGATEQPAA